MLEKGGLISKGKKKVISLIDVSRRGKERASLDRGVVSGGEGGK